MQNEQRLLNEFLELVTIDSPTYGEENISKILKQKLHELGCTDISEDTAATAIGSTTNNLYAYFPGTTTHADKVPTLLFSAHMDCVPPCRNVKPEIINGVISSKGNTILGADDKSGIAAILEALRRIRERKIPHGNIQIIFTVAEEDNVNGTKHMDTSKIRADLGYVLDACGAPGTIVYAAPGITKFTVKIHGQAAHAGLEPEIGVNAIAVAAKALAHFPQGRLDAETTANIGRITGGTATNTVADYTECHCEARSLNAIALNELTEDIIQLFEDIADEEHAKVEITTHSAYKAFILETTQPVIQLAQKAAKVIGLDVSIESTGGGSDANHFNTYGIPTSPLGTGMTAVHSTKESIRTEHLEQTCRLIMSIITLATSQSALENEEENT